MPATPIPDGFGIATVIYTRVADGHEFVTTWGYENAGAADPVSVATSASAEWIGNFTAGVTCNDYEFSGVRVLQKRAGIEEAGAHIVATVGTVSSAPAPPVVCLGITKQTARAGRKYRGRVYLPPALLPAADVDQGGVINGTHLATIQGKATGWQGDMATAGYPLYLLHKDLSAPTVIVSLECRGNARTQRRRQIL